MPRAHIIKVPVKILRRANGNVIRRKTLPRRSPQCTGDILQAHIHLAEPVFGGINQKGTLTKSMAIIIPAKESTKLMPIALNHFPSK